MFYVKSLVIFKMIIFSDLIVSYVDKIEYFNISKIILISVHPYFTWLTGKCWEWMKGKNFGNCCFILC